MQEIHALLEPSAGLLLVAVVLPFRPFVESGSVQKEPEEKFHALEVRFLFVHFRFLVSTFNLFLFPDGEFV